MVIYGDSMTNFRGPLPASPAKTWLRGAGPKPATTKPATVRAPVKTPRAPAGMGAHGRKLWAQLYPELMNAEMLTASDMAAFELLCHAYDIAKTAFLAAVAEGVIISDGRGQSRKHPGLQVARDFATVFTRLAEKFGLTPASAARFGLEVDDGDG